MKEITNIVDRDTAKLFFVLLLVFTLFLSWGGDNSWSRYSLTASIVENQSFNIEGYSHTTVDKLTSRSNFIDLNKSRNSSAKVFEKSERIYTDKAPFSSFIAIPAYILADSIAKEGADIWPKDGLSSDPIKLSLETSLKMILITFTTSAVFGAGLIAMIYSYLKDKTDPETALYTSLILGVSTPIFTYSSSYFGVINAAFFGFASFLALERSGEDKTRFWTVLSGIFTAVAVSFEYYAGLFFLGIVIYLIASGERLKTRYFISGAFLGSLPLMLYHYLISGNPLLPPAFHPQLASSGPLGGPCTIFPSCYEDYLGFVFYDISRLVNTSLRLLISPTRGLLFYSPILALAVPGFVEIYRKNRVRSILFPGIFLLFLLMQASRQNWLAGISFGPRYVVASLPFLALPLALGIKRISDRGQIWRAMIFLLAAISIFNILLGFNSWGSLDLDQETYEERFHSLEPINEGIYQEKLSDFKEYGPRSELMMSLTDRYKGIDITYRAPYGPEHFEMSSLLGNGVLLSTRFLPVMILAGLLTLIAQKRSSRLLYLGIGATVLILLLSVNVSDNYIQGESYREMELGGAVNGSMTFISHTDQDEIPYLEVAKASPRDEISIDVSVNGEERYRNQLSGNLKLALPSAKKEGRNKITIDADGCTVPALYGNSSDLGCLSFALTNSGINSTTDFEKPVLQGFYGDRLDRPWMSRKGMIIFSAEKGNGISSVSLESIPFMEEDQPRFRLNGEYVEVIDVDEEEGRTYHLTNGSTVDGINYLEIESSECYVPAEESDSEDDRCLSYRLENITRSEDAEQAIYTQGWYAEEEEGRWMRNEAEVLIRGEGDNNALNLDLDPYRGIENNTLEVYINGRNKRNISLDQRKEVMIPVEGSRSLNRIRLESRDGCVTPSKISDSSETRCISVYLRNLSITPIDRQARYQRGWHSEEVSSSGSYRWMKNRSYIIYNSTGRGLLSFTAERYEGLGNSTLSVFADGRKIAEFNGSEIENREVPVITKPGITTLRFESSEGCAVPTVVESDSDDYRCLSYKISGLKVEKTSYRDGWYSEEGDEEFSYRWMSDESNTKFISDGREKTLEFEFKPYEHLSNPALEISVNQENVGTLALNGPGRVRESIDIETERGINTLKLESQTRCVSPSNHERLSEDTRCLSFQFNRLEISD